MHRLFSVVGAAAGALAISAGAAWAQADEPASGLAAAIGSIPRDLSPWGMFLMVGLAFASVITWTVLLAKGIEVWSAKRKARVGLAHLAKARSLSQAAEFSGEGEDDVNLLVAEALHEVRMSSDAGVDGLKERIASRLERQEAASRQRIVRGIGVLATIGATAPFVGLFGTVWGIMDSFIGISKTQTTNLAVVAPGIAEALLATAMGLVVAIPAVVIYNAFSRWIAGYRAQLGDASAALLRLVSRDLDRRPQALRVAAE
jgi:biopolymer transport protein ExbB